MPRDPVQNQALVAIVRRDLAPPFADPRNLLDELIEETDPAALQRFRNERFFPSAREQRDADANEERRRRRARLLPEGGSLTYSFPLSLAVTGSAALSGGVLGPIPFPFQITEVQVSFSLVAASGVTQIHFSVFASRSDELSLNQLLVDDNIVQSGNLFFDGLPLIGVGMAELAVTQAQYTMAFAVPQIPSFLKFVRTEPAGLSADECSVTVRELVDLPIAGRVFVPPVGRININLNTAPTRARGNTTRTPRAARISVTRGGRVIAQRTLAWESLSSGIKRDYFNRQVGGESDPNIQWIP